jgi:hypothetical protein
VNVFQAERAAIADKLTGAGVPATLSPRAPLPCVLVDLPEPDNVAGPQGIGAWPAVFPVKIMVPPPGDNDAAAWQLDTLEAVLAVYPAAWRDVTYRNVAHVGDDVPAYIVPVSVSVPNPNC